MVELYQQLLELTRDGIYGYRLADGVILHANRNLVELTGVTVRAEELVGQTIAVLPQHQQDGDPITASARRDGRVSYIDARITTAAGEERWLRCDALVTTAADGEPVVQVVVREVTDRHRALLQARRESEFATAILDTAGALVVVLDREGRIVRFNHACELTTGYTSAEVLGTPLWDLFLLPEELAGVMEVWHALAAGNFPNTHENYWRTRDGGRRWIAWSNTCLSDDTGRVQHVIGCGIDMTVAREAQTRLRLSEARLEALLQLSEMTEAPLKQITDFALEEAVKLTRSSLGYLAFTNEDESVLTMYAWSREAMAECAISDKPIDYVVADTGLWGEAVRQRRPVVTNDYAAASSWKQGYPQGHVQLTRHMNVPVFDGDRIVAVAGVGNKEQPYDDSDVQQLRLLMDGMWRLLHRKRAADDLRLAHDELESRVQERTAELARSNAELEQFAYVASHDLQEPLRKITAFGDRLADKAGDALAPEARDYLQRMQSAAQRMQVLINDLLSYSRVMTQAHPFETVDLAQITAEVLADLEMAVERSGGQVEVANLPTLEADPLQMRQLLQNLISNGLKFHRPEAPPMVRLQGQYLPTPHGGWVRLTVSDNGIGFDDKHRERIFGVFQRLHDRDEYGGTGIGLALCRKIVERHGGAITAHGVPGEGATFSISLPLKQREGEE